MNELNIYLDDLREDLQKEFTHPIYATEEWIWIKSHEEFVEWVQKNGLPKRVSFDHDMSPEHYSGAWYPYGKSKNKTGWHTALWFCEYCKKQGEWPEIYVHSRNPIGRNNIKNLFRADGIEPLGL